MLRSARSVPSHRLEAWLSEDIYTQLAGRLVERGDVREAHVIVGSDAEAEYRVGAAHAYGLARFDLLPDPCRDGDVLWVRGGSTAYFPALRRGRWRRWLFYAADRNLVPRRFGGFDAVLLDDRRYVPIVEIACPGAAALNFIKTADPAVFHPLANTTRDVDVVVLANMNIPVKKVAELVPIARRLPDLRYMVIGRTDDALCAELRATGATVTFTGPQPRPRVNELLNRARAALILAEEDGAPRTLLETMAAGVPQIVNRRLIAGLDYVDPRAGVIAALDRFAQTIERVLSEPQRFDPAAVFHERFAPAQAEANLASAVRHVLAHPAPGTRRWRSCLALNDLTGRVRRRLMKWRLEPRIAAIREATGAEY